MIRQQLDEVLSWRFVTEFWRRFPNRYRLIETHPCSGQYDCLGLMELDGSFHSVLDINRGGSLHVHEGRTPRSWTDWKERMLAEPRKFIDEVTNSIGITIPKHVPKSTAATVSFRYICEFLTHTIGRRDYWECRNGFCDTSDYGGGVRKHFFEQFSGIENNRLERPVAGERLASAYDYWFLVKDEEPLLCINIAGQIYRKGSEMIDIGLLYGRHKRIWPVICETALELLP